LFTKDRIKVVVYSGSNLVGN